MRRFISIISVVFTQLLLVSSALAATKVTVDNQTGMDLSTMCEDLYQDGTSMVVTAQGESSSRQVCTVTGSQPNADGDYPHFSFSLVFDMAKDSIDTLEINEVDGLSVYCGVNTCVLNSPISLEEPVDGLSMTVKMISDL